MGSSHYRVEAEEMKRTAEKKKKKTKRRQKNGGCEAGGGKSIGRGRDAISAFYFFQELIEIEIIYRSTCSEAGLIRSIRENDREMSSGSLSSRDRGKAAS